MSKILIIVKKELLRILTDKRLCFTTIIMPGLMIFIMYALVGNVMSNTYSTLQNSEYTVVINNVPNGACGHFFRPLCLYSFYNLED